MDIGDPIIYTCPICGKKMEMTTFTSYTVSSSKAFSDGEVTKSGICCPNFTPDLAKCPHCKKLFFRHDDKTAKSVNFYENKVKAEIEDPEREDLINAVKNKIFKKWKDEKILREMLWRSLNDDIRHGYGVLTGEELKFWQDNCVALLRLEEKTLKDNDEERETCLLMMAELNRNLGNFDKCMELINSFSGKWSWLKKQFAWECKAKNIFTFELLSKKEMNLEKEKDQYAKYYYDRAKKFLPLYYGRKNFKKALADYNKAEDLGMTGTIFYEKRGLLYLDELNDPDSAISDFSKALKQKDNYIENSKIGLLIFRSNACFKKGNLKKALADIQTAINENEDNDRLYFERSKIYEAMGDKDKNPQDFYKAAEKDRKKAEKLEQRYLKMQEKEREKYEAIVNKPVKILKMPKKRRRGEL